MSGLNKIILIGNLGRDPEMRYTPSGSPVTTFSLAVNRQTKTADGEQRDETDWFNVSCWDRLAEIANEYLAKGRQVYVEGRVRGRLYSTQAGRHAGEPRMSLDVTATHLVLLASGQREPVIASASADTAGADTAAAEESAIPF